MSGHGYSLGYAAPQPHNGSYARQLSGYAPRADEAQLSGHASAHAAASTPAVPATSGAVAAEHSRAAVSGIELKRLDAKSRHLKVRSLAPCTVCIWLLFAARRGHARLTSPPPPSTPRRRSSGTARRRFSASAGAALNSSRTSCAAISSLGSCA